MDENCKRQKEVERTYGGLLPAVEGHSLGTTYKVQFDSDLCIHVYEDAVQVDIFIFLLLYIQICP